MTLTISERLRMACNEIRRNKMALADLIPLMQAAADEIDRLQAEVLLHETEVGSETGRVK